MDPRAVLCLGEIVIDLIGEPAGPLESTVAFVPRVGGAPANVAVGLSRLGVPARFVGSVGDDEFAEVALRRMAREGVGLNGIIRERGAQTRCAIVVGPAGGRSFTFYGHPAADGLLTPEVATAPFGEDVAALYLGSLPLTVEPSRGALLAAARVASDRGIPVCFDPNPRGAWWGKGEPARAALIDIAQLATVIKLSVQDLVYLGWERAEVRALAQGARLVVFTDGARGCEWWVDEQCEIVPPLVVESRDEVGAGDAFMAALIARGVAAGFRFTRADVEFAAVAGALATTVTGAMDAMPTREAVASALGRARRGG